MKKKGFTIIEVVLVLGIAGLILTMALIALPSLARSQRDTQRKSDVMKVADAVKKFQSNNNRGSLPSSQSELVGSIEKFGLSRLSDPDGFEYEYKYVKCDTNNTGKIDNGCVDSEASLTKVLDENTFNTHRVYFIYGAHCGGENSNTPVKSASPRKAALVYKLEVGELFCYEI